MEFNALVRLGIATGIVCVGIGLVIAPVQILVTARLVVVVVVVVITVICTV
jgi:hypothetical protein